jgi:outer membrane protein TolC
MRSIAVFAALSLSAQLAAQETPLTLQEAVERAQAQAPRLLQLASLKDAADAATRGARGGRWPSLELSAAYTYNSDVPELEIVSPGPPPTRLLVFPNINNQYKTRASVNLPLYTGGRVGGGIQGATAQASAAGGDLEAARHDLTLETRTAYWSLVSARESERVLAEAVGAFEAHLRDAQNRATFGLAARNEVLLVQVERDRAELSRIQAQNGSAIANANLQRLLGLPPAARVVPTEPRAAADAIGDSPDTEALVEKALRARPEIAALRARVDAAAATARVAHSSRRPQLYLHSAYDYALPNSKILPLTPEWKGTWYAGASLVWNVFDGGRTSASAAQAEAQQQALLRTLEDLVQRIRLEVTARTLDLATARSAVTVAERNLEAARENLRVSKERYREGVILSSDLLDAETALQRAGLDETSAAVSLRLALANLERAIAR